MPTTLRNQIITLLGFCLILAATPAHAFDRIAASTQYQQWLAQLKSDIDTVYRQVPREQTISKADIARWCAESVVPGSRGDKDAQPATGCHRRNSALQRASDSVKRCRPAVMVLIDDPDRLAKADGWRWIGVVRQDDPGDKIGPCHQ